MRSATNLKQAAFAAWFVLPFVGALAAEADFHHVTIARESGKFLGWPANHGPMHAWGDDFQTDRHNDADLGYPRMFQRPDGRLVTAYYCASAERVEPHIAATIWQPPPEPQP